MIGLIILLLVGLALTEVHGLIYFFWPQTSQIEYDLFLDKSYHNKITVLWYVYEMANILNRIIWALVLAKISTHVSFKMFKVGVVFVGYYICQFIFYVVNRNTSYLANYCLYFCMACIIGIILWPMKDEFKLRKI